MIAEAAIAAMRCHAEAEFPNESCGLVVGGEYRPCANVAGDPATRFRIADGELLPALRGGDLDAVVHSHPWPHPPVPSLADMRAQIDMAAAWGIVPVGELGDAGLPFWWGPGVEIPPLLDRPYRWGVTDCFALVRDWYRLAGVVELPDHPRDWTAHRTGAADSYEDLYRAAGFAEVDRRDAAVGDALLIQIGGGRAANHAAVIVEPGVMLHHPGGGRPYDPRRRPRRGPVSRWADSVRRAVRFAP